MILSFIPSEGQIPRSSAANPVTITPNVSPTKRTGVFDPPTIHSFRNQHALQLAAGLLILFQSFLQKVAL